MTTTKSGVRFTAPDDQNAAPIAAQHNVTVRVLPKGAGRVFTGAVDDAASDPKGRFPTYGKGAVFEVDAAIASDLEARGVVEIQP